MEHVHGVYYNNNDCTCSRCLTPTNFNAFKVAAHEHVLEVYVFADIIVTDHMSITYFMSRV